MILVVADVHGAATALRSTASRGAILFVLGDLINFVDYRTNEGLVADVSGRDFVAEMVRLRTAGAFDAAGRLWQRHAAGREDDLRRRYDALVEAAYEQVCGALEGCEAYVTYGNADRPSVLRRYLPEPARFVDGDVVDLDGERFGFVGGGTVSLGTPGEVNEDDMAAKLAMLGDVDVLCTHVPPAITPLASDVIGGRQKGSAAVLRYIEQQQPRLHYFGDVHQPQATTWTIGSTVCHNAGYFRATGRAIRHG